MIQGSFEVAGVKQKNSQEVTTSSTVGGMLMMSAGQRSSGAVEPATFKPLPLPALLLLEELMDVIGGHDLSQDNPWSRDRKSFANIEDK